MSEQQHDHDESVASKIEIERATSFKCGSEFFRCSIRSSPLLTNIAILYWRCGKFRTQSQGTQYTCKRRVATQTNADNAYGQRSAQFSSFRCCNCAAPLINKEERNTEKKKKCHRPLFVVWRAHACMRERARQLKKTSILRFSALFYQQNKKLVQ